MRGRRGAAWSRGRALGARPPAPAYLGLGTLAEGPDPEAGAPWVDNGCSVATLSFLCRHDHYHDPSSPRVVCECWRSRGVLQHVGGGGPREGMWEASRSSRARPARSPRRRCPRPSAASVGRGSRRRAGPATAAVGLLGGEGPVGQRGGETPLNSSPAPRCRGRGPTAGKGAPGLADPSGASAARSAPFASGAGRAPTQCARARRRVRRRPAPPPRPPRPRRPPPHTLCECRRRRRLPRLESACWR